MKKPDSRSMEIQVTFFLNEEISGRCKPLYDIDLPPSIANRWNSVEV